MPCRSFGFRPPPMRLNWGAHQEDRSPSLPARVRTSFTGQHSTICGTTCLMPTIGLQTRRACPDPSTDRMTSEVHSAVLFSRTGQSSPFPVTDFVCACHKGELSLFKMLARDCLQFWL